jgi:hypothetical protein
MRRNGRLGAVKRIEVACHKIRRNRQICRWVLPVPDTRTTTNGWATRRRNSTAKLRTHPQGKDGEANFGRPGWMVRQAYSWV